MAMALTLIEVQRRADGQHVDRRPCGACTACCTVLGAAELGKPYYCTCKKLGDAGCTVYDGRPQSFLQVQ
jgi:hypothetical protein